MASKIQLAFQKNYERTIFIKEILIPTFNSSRVTIFSETINETDKLSASETKIIKTVSQYGILNLNDDSQIKLYEIILQPSILLEYNKIGIQNYIRKTLITGEAVLVNFIPDNNKSTWRFSFIDQDIKIINQKLTKTKSNPKRYTYIVGKTEVCKTIADRMATLEKATRIVLRPTKIDEKTPNLLNIFSVEILSKTFFDDYKYIHYSRFVEAVMGWSVVKKGKIDVWTKTGKESAFYIKAFKEKYTEEKAQAEARNFVKKLLGRIVFLYFVQKKGWLGASNTDYIDGFDGTISSKDGNGDGFMLHLFKSSNSKDNFYEIWLKKLFFKTLNEPRIEDNFTMPDKSIVKIPFLNGGLFEEETHDKIPTIFDAKLFHNPDFNDDLKQSGFLDFLNSFNFTIYEDSPEDHTVAVDPEMLGHIFENLLEDNKDKGAYYTPKEIVHYMCQESIIEYLNTKLNPEQTPIYYDSSGLALIEKENKTLLTHANPDYDNNRLEIEDFVKNKVHNEFLLKNAKDVNKFLDAVKICDPAIGSGAFPMGLMQEIFALKMVLYDLEYETADQLFHEKDLHHQNYRRDTKLNIIQNSIYGVDIEKGAVDIARLRFWLSLIVDENKPQALPNLDYKIVVGDSLIPKFDGDILEVDWDKKNTISPKFNTFITTGKQLLAEIVNKQKAYFDPRTKNKPKAAAEIRNLKINLLLNQLAYNRLYFLYNNEIKIDSGLGLSAKERQNNIAIDLHIAQLDKQTSKLQKLLQHTDLAFDHFDWKLDFPEILNDQVADVVGFDIVIGNPPYVQVPKGIYYEKQFPYSEGKDKGKQNLYKVFVENSYNLLKENGVATMIVQSSLMCDVSSQFTRELLLTKTTIKEILEFPKKAKTKEGQVFDNVLQGTCIYNFTKTTPKLNQKFNVSIDNDVTTIPKLKYEKLTQQELISIYPNGFFIPLVNENNFVIIQKLNSDAIPLIEYIENISQGDINLTSESKYFSNIISEVVLLRGKDTHKFEINYKTDEFIQSNHKANVVFFNQKFEYLVCQQITGTTDKFRLHFALTNKNYKFLFGNSVNKFYLKNQNYNLFILAILNSKLMDWYFRRTSTNNHVNGYEIEQLPIKIIESQQPFITLVDKILEGKKSGNVTQHWEDEIDIRVYHLYGLSYQEACIIEESSGKNAILSLADFEKYKI